VLHGLSHWISYRTHKPQVVSLKLQKKWEGSCKGIHVWALNVYRYIALMLSPTHSTYGHVYPFWIMKCITSLKVNLQWVMHIGHAI
jgi:hypothetical protein